VGGFEFDLDDGEVRFKTSLPLGNAAASPEPAAMDRYLPGLIAVAQMGMDPVKAAAL